MTTAQEEGRAGLRGCGELTSDPGRVSSAGAEGDARSHRPLTSTLKLSPESSAGTSCLWTNNSGLENPPLSEEQQLLGPDHDSLDVQPCLLVQTRPTRPSPQT